MEILGLLYADEVVLCSESKENFKVIVGCFYEVYRGSVSQYRYEHGDGIGRKGRIGV